MKAEVSRLVGHLWQGRVAKQGQVHEESIPCNPVDTALAEAPTLVESFSLLGESSLSTPRLTSIAITASGDLLVADQANKVVKLLRDGSLLRNISTSDALFGVARAGNDDVVVSDRTLHIFDDSGKLKQVLRAQPRECQGVATHEDNLYTLDASMRCLYVINMTSGIVQKVLTQAAEPFKKPSWVDVGRNGIIAISDPEASTVSIFNQNYNLIGQCRDLIHPGDVIVGKEGVMICETGRNRIVACDFNGNSVRLVIGDCGFLHHPQAIAAQGNRLYVAETDGHLKVFQMKL
jgi:hypothetical protein